MLPYAATAQPMEQVIVETRDRFARHGEELVRSRYAAEVADRPFEWPHTGVTRENFRDTEVIVARVDGAVAGRAILDMAFYPLAELENLEVLPPFRSRGVGRAIVRYAVETAARAGFLAIHAQTSKENVAAQRLYAYHGFMPATRGEMLRVWKFLNLPALSQFVHDHPMALLESAPASDREHVLCWHDPGSKDDLAVTIHGGSCQSDSDGTGPALSRLRLRSGSLRIAASLDARPAARQGGTFSIHVTLSNEGEDELTGGFRAGLNPGFRMAPDCPGGQRLSLPGGAAIEHDLSITTESDFPVATLGICAYPSVPMTVDFLLGDHTFWLASQVPAPETE